MTLKEQDEFINKVYVVAKEHPELQLRVSQAFQSGTLEHIKELKEQCMDMETIAVGFSTLSSENKISKNTKVWVNNLILSKLKKHKDSKFWCDWTPNIEKIENYLKSEGLLK